MEDSEMSITYENGKGKKGTGKCLRSLKEFEFWMELKTNKSIHIYEINVIS